MRRFIAKRVDKYRKSWDDEEDSTIAIRCTLDLVVCLAFAGMGFISGYVGDTAWWIVMAVVSLVFLGLFHIDADILRRRVKARGDGSE